MTMCIRGTGFLLLLFAVAFGAPNYAVAQPPVPTSGAVLYEITENLSLKALKGGQRKATSQLMGTALVGTPLCPAALAQGALTCTINATGSDTISLATGLGSFGGTFTIVVQGDNRVDSPELVVGRGHFSGKIDFSPVFLNNPPVPLGSVVGEMALSGSRPVAFTGVFRLPFVYPPLAGDTPLFLIDPTKFGVEPVAANEMAVGYPTVKLEISF